METGQAARILYVDDDEELIYIYSRFLEKEPFVLNTATNGKDALELALSFGPDLIISDVAMPQMGGMELCRRVRSLAALESVMFMLVSGIEVEGEDVAAGLEAGADEYLVKPFSKEELVARIRLLLSVKELKQKAAFADTVYEDNQKLRGTLEAGVAELKEELARERDALSTALKQVASLVDERQRALEQVAAESERARRSVAAATDALVKILDARPDFRRAHGRSVAQLALAMGEMLGLEGDALWDLETAGRLHRLGLLGTSDAVATRHPLDLSEAQSDLLCQHPVRAAEMLGSIPGLEGVAHLICHIFERIDGKGTPRGLKGETIPLGARILAVAEAHETLAAWPQGHTVDDCLGRLEEEAGTRFDPKVVQALGRHLGRKPESGGEPLVEVGICEVEPGMELVRPLYTSKGAMLLPENTVLTENSIRQIARYNRIDPLDETVFIKG